MPLGRLTWGIFLLKGVSCLCQPELARSFNVLFFLLSSFLFLVSSFFSISFFFLSNVSFTQYQCLLFFLFKVVFPQKEKRGVENNLLPNPIRKKTNYDGQQQIKKKKKKKKKTTRRWRLFSFNVSEKKNKKGFFFFFFIPRRKNGGRIIIRLI